MATVKQIEANRKNAQNSTGPKTPAGKAAVRFNALKSGIAAASLIIPGEDPEKLKTLSEEFTQTWKPADPIERELVDQLIDDAWRLRRFRTAETQLWTASIETSRSCIDHRPHTEAGDAYSNSSQTLGRLQRIVAGIKRSNHQTAADLQRLQAARAKTAPAEPLTESHAAAIEVVEQSQFGDAHPADAPDTPLTIAPEEHEGHAFWEKLAS